MFVSQRTKNQENARINIDLEFEDREFPVVLMFDRLEVYLSSVEANALAAKLNVVMREFDRRTVELYE